MPHYIPSYGKYIFFVSKLPGIVMMDNVRHSVLISSVRHQSNVFLKYNDISTLPFFYLVYISSKNLCIIIKICFLVSYSSKVYIGIRFIYIVVLYILCNIIIYKLLQVIACCKKTSCNHICTYTIVIS